MRKLPSCIVITRTACLDILNLVSEVLYKEFCYIFVNKNGFKNGLFWNILEMLNGILCQTGTIYFIILISPAIILHHISDRKKPGNINQPFIQPTCQPQSIILKRAENNAIWTIHMDCPEVQSNGICEQLFHDNALYCKGYFQ